MSGGGGGLGTTREKRKKNATTGGAAAPSGHVNRRLLEIELEIEPRCPCNWDTTHLDERHDIGHVYT